MKKGNRIDLRLTGEEKAMVEKRAAESGMKVSEYIRFKVLEAGGALTEAAAKVVKIKKVKGVAVGSAILCERCKRHGYKKCTLQCKKMAAAG